MNKLKATLTFLALIYMLVPVIFKYSPFIQRSLLFMHYVNPSANLTHPESSGIKCARTFILHNHFYTLNAEMRLDPPIKLGAWHIVPHSRLPSCATKHSENRTSIDDKLAFDDSRPIVLYVHGNGGHRAVQHRLQMYRRMAYEHDYHIVTFDYSGYGDSTFQQPTSHTLNADATFMYSWLLKQPNVTKDRIVVWGHSLGTAVAVRMIDQLPKDMKPKRLILEAPFDSISNAVMNHPFSTPFRILPYFEEFFVEPIQKSSDLNFDSASRIGNFKHTQILILHAEDDAIIPIRLGQNLYVKALERLDRSQVKFVSISASHRLGHKLICTHDETMSEVKEFVEK